MQEILQGWCKDCGRDDGNEKVEGVVKLREKTRERGRK